MLVNWKLDEIYKSDALWEEGKQDLVSDIEKFEQTLDDLFSEKRAFFEILKLKILIDEKIERVYCYPRRYLDINIDDEVHKKMFNEALDIYNRILKNTADFENRLRDNKDTVLKYLEDSELSFYKRYLEIIFNKKVSASNDAFTSIQNVRASYQKLISESLIFNSITIDGKEVIVDNTTYGDILDNENQDIRLKAYEAMAHSYQSIEEDIFNLYKEKLKKEIENARLQGYKSLKEMKLEELELPSTLIDKTIEAVQDNLGIIHRYAQSKKDLSQLEEYHTYDAAYPKFSNAESNIPIEDALKIVKESLKILGDEYLSYIDKLAEGGSIDVYPKKGKKTITSTSITYAGIPYICLNYYGKPNNVRTLAHELGHALNLVYSKNSNEFVYFEFSLFITEVIAKVNEYLYNYYLLNKSSSLENLTNVISALANSLYSQVMLTEFEDTIITTLEEGKDVTLEEVYQLYSFLLTKYNGPSFTLCEWDKYSWLKIPHFVLQDSYYFYQYSISASLANLICYKILHEEGFAGKYLEFLKIGNKLNIIDSLKTLGIDLLDANLFNKSFSLFDDYVKKYELLAKKA